MLNSAFSIVIVHKIFINHLYKFLYETIFKAFRTEILRIPKISARVTLIYAIKTEEMKENCSKI